MKWYSDQDHIEKKVQTLDGFRELIVERSKARDKGEHDLGSFVIRGNWWLSPDANVMKMERAVDPEPTVLTDSEFRMIHHGTPLGGPVTWLPPKGSQCNECKVPWDIDNVHLAVDYKSEGNWKWDHEACIRIASNNADREKFKNLFQELGIQYGTISETPNLRCSCEFCANWFVFPALGGKITIGWRKSVIHIGWDSIDVDVEALFGDQETTKSPGMIHAWGYERARHYLWRLKERKTIAKVAEIIEL